MKQIATLFFTLLSFSPALADGNWKTQVSNDFVGITYQKEKASNGFTSFSAAIDSLAKSGDISRLSSVNITNLMAVDRKLDREVKIMLQRDWPDEFKAAQKSAGNMHNPALGPIYKPFIECLLKASLMKDLKKALSQHGLRLEPVFIEKFSFVDRDGFRPFWGFAYLEVVPSVEAQPKTGGGLDADGQPAAAPESKSEGKDEPELESEVRPQ